MNNRKLLHLFCAIGGLFLLSVSSTLVNAQTVKLYPTTIRVEKGKTKTITAVAYNAAGQPVYNAEFTNFTGNNSSIASLSSVRINVTDDIRTVAPPPPNLRTITGNSAGTVVVTATWNNITSNSATIIVDDTAAAPTAVIHGDNDASGGTSISTKVGEAIEINADSSQGVSQSEWNWGDGDKTTDLLSATHAYLVAGTYNLTLKTINNTGQIATSTITVNVQSQTVCDTSNTITANSVADLRLKYENLPLSGGKCILLAPQVYVGELELVARNFTDYVTIGSNAAMPAIQNRITPNDSGLVTIQSSTSGSDITPMIIDNGATKLRFVGIKFDPAYAAPNSQAVNSNFYVVQIGQAFSQTNVSQNPSKIIFEHCVINPNDDVKVAHGILNDGYKVSIISSWLGNVKTFGAQDSQAVVSYDGRGAHVYNNNFLEAASENILYGGVVPHINGITSANVEIRRCYFSKKLSWRYYDLSGPDCFHQVNEKNLFETKNARRVYVEGSAFENHWDGCRSQLFAFVFKSATTPGEPGEFVPWAISEDVILENNKLNHVYGGITNSIDRDISSAPFYGLKPSNIKFKNSLIDDISSTRWGVPGNTALDGRFLQPNNVEDLQVDHVTVIDKDQTAGDPIAFVTNNNFRFKITNSIFGINDYGILGSSAGSGIQALNPGTGGGVNGCTRDINATWNVAGNIMPIYGASSSCYPSVTPYYNQYPTNYNAVGFTDLTNGNYTLTTSSIGHNQATDGTDIGANIPLLNQRTACTISGIGTNCSSTQTPYPGPNPLNIPITLEAENFDNGGQGVAYNDTFGSTGSSAYRSNPVEAVDIQARSTASNGYVVFEAAAGEWLKYTINVPVARKYDIGVRYASEFNNGTFHIEIDGVNVTQTMTVASTGNWGVFKNLTKRGVMIAAGTHVVRLVMDTNSPDGCNCIVGNFDAIRFNSTLFDFDNDGKADISVFHPSTNSWYLDQSTAGFTAVVFGVSTDIITPADFDGDGKTDLAVFRPSNGTWYLQRSSLGFTGVAFGQNGDIPVQADYDGDGKADIAVFRPSNGTWYLLQSTNGFVGIQFGQNNDKPAVGDFDGDGKADLAVFRPSTVSWYIQNSSNAVFVSVPFGAASDNITPADYDGDGKTDIAVFRPSNGSWYIRRSLLGDTGVAYGQNGDLPVPADYDGDGKADVAIFRPSTGGWSLLRSTESEFNETFGQIGDIPIPSTYVR